MDTGLLLKEVDHLICFNSATLAALGAGIAVLVLGSPYGAGVPQSGAPTQAPLPVGFPPLEVLPFGESYAHQVVNDHQGIDADIIIDAYAKEVTLAYAKFAAGSLTETVESSHSFSTRFWPNAACWLDDDTLCVAGFNGTSGRTVVEAWDFAPPSASVDVDGFEFITPGSRVSVSVVYNEDVPGRQYVDCLSVFRGASSPSLLVQFYDSRELYLMPAQSGLPSVLLAGPDQGAPLVEPALDKQWSHIDAREHATQGYAYLFKGGHVQDPLATTLIFWDYDKDGVLDSTVELDRDQWAASGLGKPSNWL